jgi:tight adherence protein C
MMIGTFLINLIPIALTFASVGLLIYALGKLYSEFQVNQRVKQLTKNNQSQSSKNLAKPERPKKNWDNLLRPLYQLSLPNDGLTTSQSRLKFIQAGFRNRTAPSIYLAIKTILFLALPLFLILPLLSFLPNKSTLTYGFYLLCAGTLGYYLPDIFLSYRIKHRKTEMQQNLPDLMDLLVICSEAGLGLDAALNRVSVDIRRSSEVLSEEFYLACLEIRAGASRLNALKNLAMRVDLDDLHALVAMLVQADKFGTSLGESLRIHSEFMRVKRMQRAEEIAAKIPVKMLFPLVFLIFPILMMVMLGPAIIQIGQVFNH